MQKNGKSRFSAKISLSHNTKKMFVVTTSKFQNIWDLENFLWYHDFPSNSYCLTVPKNFVRNHLMFQNAQMWGVKKIINKNGISRLPVENFFAHSAERFRCGKLWYIRKVRLSKNFMLKRVISFFSVDFFSCILPVKFVTESLFVSESLRHRWLYAQRRALRFSVGFFGLPLLKNFVGNPFNLWESFGYRNFQCMKTENHVFLPKFLCLTIPKKFVVTTSKFQIFWDIEKFLSYHDFPSNFFVSQYRKISWGTI